VGTPPSLYKHAVPRSFLILTPITYYPWSSLLSSPAQYLDAPSHIHHQFTKSVTEHTTPSDSVHPRMSRSPAPAASGLALWHSSASLLKNVVRERGSRTCCVWLAPFMGRAGDGAHIDCVIILLVAVLCSRPPPPSNARACRVWHHLFAPPTPSLPS
jgi:hypothetical protein